MIFARVHRWENQLCIQMIVAVHLVCGCWGDRINKEGWYVKE